MRYQENEWGLAQLFKDLEPVQNTFPPVYLLGSILIGYDKGEQICILAINNEPVQIDGYWNRARRACMDRITG